MKILVTPHDTENKIYTSEIDTDAVTVHLGKGAELFDDMEHVTMKYAETHEIVDTELMES